MSTRVSRALKTKSTHSGIDGIAVQDGSLQESMRPIVDRSKENLASTDNGIIMARHRLMRAARTLAEEARSRAVWRSRTSACAWPR